MERRRFLLALLGLAGMVVGCAPRQGTTHVTPTTARARALRTARPRARFTPSRGSNVVPRTSGALSLVALGDSVPYGSGCSCDIFPTLVGQKIADRRGVEVVIDNLAVPGATSSDCIEDIHKTASTRAALKGCHLALICVGANDLDISKAAKDECYPAHISGCWDDQVTSMRAHIAAIVDEVRGLAPEAGIAIIGYWNVFADGAAVADKGEGYRVRSDSLTVYVNDVLRQLAKDRSCVYVDTYTAFKGEYGLLDPTKYLAADGDHLNAEGHRVVAESVMAALRGH